MTTAATDLNRTPPRELARHVSPQARLVHLMDKWDVTAVVLWAFAVVYSTYEPLAAVTTVTRYAMAAYFTVGFFFRSKTTMPLLIKCWPMLLIAVLSIISALWAPSATMAFRKALLVALTAFLSIYIALRTPGRKIVLIYMLVSLPAGILCVIEPNIIGGAASGFFGQKNFLAIHMFILAMTGVVVALDKTYSAQYRLLAIPSICIGAYMIFLSLSATTVVLFILAAPALLFHQLVWKNLVKLRHMRWLLLLGIMTLLLLAIFVIVALLQTDIESAFFELLGKDRTLTGRTVMWARAERILELYPWTGVGPGGFWNESNGDARQVLSDLGINIWIELTFHNTYLEYGSMFGYPGVVAAAIIVIWTTVYSLICWLRAQTLQNAFFLIFCLLALVRAGTEADLTLEISNVLVLFYIAGARGVIAASRPKSAPPIT